MDFFFYSSIFIYLSLLVTEYSVTWRRERDIIKGQSNICTLLSSPQGVLSVIKSPGTAYYKCRMLHFVLLYICLSYYCDSDFFKDVNNFLESTIIQFSILISLPPVCVYRRAAQDVTDGSQYFVLLMITDGVISDMVQTKEAVVNVRSFKRK